MLIKFGGFLFISVTLKAYIYCNNDIEAEDNAYLRAQGTGSAWNQSRCWVRSGVTSFLSTACYYASMGYNLISFDR